MHAAQSETQSTDQQLKSIKELIRKLENNTGDDLFQLRDRLKNAIAQLVERIELFSDGLKDRVLTGDAFSGPNCERVGDLIRHYENIGNDSDIFKPGEYDALIGELFAYEALNTGKNRPGASLIRFQSRRVTGWFET